MLTRIGDRVSAVEKEVSQFRSDPAWCKEQKQKRV